MRSRITLVALLSLLSTPALALEQADELVRPAGTRVDVDDVTEIYHGKLTKPVRTLQIALRSVRDCPIDLYEALPREVHEELYEIDYSTTLVLIVTGDSDRIVQDELILSESELTSDGVLHVLYQDAARPQQDLAGRVHVVAVSKGWGLSGKGWGEAKVEFTRSILEKVTLKGQLRLVGDQLTLFALTVERVSGNGTGALERDAPALEPGLIEFDVDGRQWRLFETPKEILRLVPTTDLLKRLKHGESLSVTIKGHGTRIQGSSRLRPTEIQFGDPRIRLERKSLQGVVSPRSVRTAKGLEVRLFQDPSTVGFLAAWRAGKSQRISNLVGWAVLDGKGDRLNRFHLSRAAVTSKTLPGAPPAQGAGGILPWLEPAGLSTRDPSLRVVTRPLK